MPDDCGYLEDRFLRKLNKRVNAVEYVPYTRTCPYCRTNPEKDTCVNCGAPQVREDQRMKKYTCL